MNQQSRVRGDKIDHRWQMVIHVDGCHHFSSVYRCVDCGATLTFYAERDLKADPWSAVWMEPGYDEDGNEIRCERCRELADGAEPMMREEFALA